MILDDADLLSRYAAHHDEAAFAALVHRHLSLVLGTARRHLGDDSRHAEDAAQAVFTLLARRAAMLHHHPALLGWLHLTTRRICSQIRRGERRRSARETSSAILVSPMIDPEPTTDWAQLRPALDDALLELPATDRELLLARFFGGRSFAALGTTLRLSEDAARMRCQRALERLRQRLGRRGITSTGAALALVLTEQAAFAAPAGLAANITAGALAAPAASLLGSIATVPAIALLKLKFLSGPATALVVAATTAATLALAIALRPPPPSPGETSPHAAATVQPGSSASANDRSAAPTPPPTAAPPLGTPAERAPSAGRGVPAALFDDLYGPVLASLDLPPARLAALRQELTAQLAARTQGAPVRGPGDVHKAAIRDLLNPPDYARFRRFVRLHSNARPILQSLSTELARAGLPLTPPARQSLAALFLREAAASPEIETVSASMLPPVVIARALAAAEATGKISPAQHAAATAFLTARGP